VRVSRTRLLDRGGIAVTELNEAAADPTFEELLATIARYDDPDDKLTIALGNFNRLRAERDDFKRALIEQTERLTVALGEASELSEKRLAIIGALFEVLNKHPELNAEVVSALAALSPDADLLKK